MVSEEEKHNKKDLLGGLILIGCILILFCVLFYMVTFVYGLSEVIHENKIKELNLEKEIALIHKKEFKGEVNYNRSGFPCVIEVLQYNGDTYEQGYEFVDTCWEVNK